MAPCACFHLVVLVVKAPVLSLHLSFPLCFLPLEKLTHKDHKCLLVLLVLAVRQVVVLVALMTVEVRFHRIPHKCHQDLQTGQSLGEEGGSSHQNRSLVLRPRMSL